MRTLAGLMLAIMVAPVATALCFSFEFLVIDGPPITAVKDLLGGTLAFVVFALLFGTVIAAIPGLVFGGIAIVLARHLETRSPLYFAVMGILAAMAMAWLDTKRTGGTLRVLDALPFLVGGCLGALTYWRVAERDALRRDEDRV